MKLEKGLENAKGVYLGSVAKKASVGRCHQNRDLNELREPAT